MVFTRSKNYENDEEPLDDSNVSESTEKYDYEYISKHEEKNKNSDVDMKQIVKNIELPKDLVLDNTNTLKECKISLEKVATGNVLEIINFTPLLFQFMTHNLPDDAQGLTRTLGIRAAAILTITKQICEHEKYDDKEEEKLPATYTYVLLFVIGYMSSIHEFRTICAISFINLVLNTDKMIHYKQYITQHKIWMYAACMAAHYESSLLINICQLICCVIMFESNCLYFT